LTFSYSIAAIGSVQIDCVVQIDLGNSKGRKSGGGKELRLTISSPDLQTEQYIRVEE
jgi:hypothetical protein